MAGGRGLAMSSILLIVVAGMERFTFKGVASNMMSYLTDVVKMSNSSAAKMVNNWCGLTYLVPLLVAPLADSFLDRYSIILLSSLPYLLGLFALTSRAFRWPWRARTNTSTASTLLGWSLALISFGLGVYTASLQAFGADQLDYDQDDDQEDPGSDGGGGEESSDRRSRFFQRWYFGICCGCLLGVVGMSYIQDTLGWGLGFAIPTVVMVASVALFLCGTRFYRFKKRGVESNPLVQAIKGRVASRLRKRGGDSVPAEKSEVVLVVELHEQIQSPLYDGDSNGGKKQDRDNGTNPLDLAKLVLRLLPTWMTLLTFAVIFQQPATFFTRQGMTMERNIMGTRIKVPPAALQSAIAVSVILLMPLYNKAFIPSIRAFTRNEKGVTVRQRMGIGMLLSVVAMVVAAATERRRLRVSRRQAGDGVVVPMSIFWLLPQYILLGVSDIFTVVGMQEFFYSAVPENMRTFGVALNTSVFGVGNFLGSAVIAAIEHFTCSRSAGEHRSWFSDDMREARLDYYYWFLATTSGISLAAFILFCKLVRVR